MENFCFQLNASYDQQGIDDRVLVEVFLEGGSEFTAIVIDVGTDIDCHPVVLLPTEVGSIIFFSSYIFSGNMNTFPIARYRLIGYCPWYLDTRSKIFCVEPTNHLQIVSLRILLLWISYVVRRRSTDVHEARLWTSFALD